MKILDENVELISRIIPFLAMRWLKSSSCNQIAVFDPICLERDHRQQNLINAVPSYTDNQKKKMQPSKNHTDQCFLFLPRQQRVHYCTIIPFRRNSL